ncbi:MAG: beta-lactamase family protein [Clostridiales bacterium]|nr:beta-lactamase family protein [Clostridiales bacterium]
MDLVKYAIISMVLFVLVFSVSTPIFATDSPLRIPEDRLGQTIDAYVEEHKSTTAAVSIAVFTKDNVLFEDAYGYVNIEEEIENNADTVIEWGSITKLLVWVSIMQLVEEGKIDLNEDIRTYLPNDFLSKLKYDDPVTMIHLMNHNAGWQEVILGMVVIEGVKTMELGDALQAMEPVQVYRPGEYTAYSNYGAALAGYIVEQVTGKPFSDYVYENIFIPLGIKHTALKPDWSDNQWVKDRGGQLVRYTTDLQNLGTQPFQTPLYPCGQATGTISDLRKFAMALLPDENGGTVLFGKTEALAALYAPSSYFPDGKTARFCHGFWALVGCRGFVIGHAGNTTACSSMLAIDPIAGVGAVVMTNQQQEGIFNYRLLYKILGEKERLGGGSFTEEDISGVYTPSQNIYKGTLKIIRIFQTTPVFRNDEGFLYNPIGGAAFEYVAPGEYNILMGDRIMPAYAEFDQAGKVVKLSITPMDFIPTSWGKIIFDIASLLFLAIAGLYGLATLMVMLIRKIRKRQQLMGGLRVAVCGSAFAALINSVILLSLAIVIVQGVLFIFFALMSVVCVPVMLFRAIRLELSKKQKCMLTVTSAVGLVTAFNIIYWQLWMFWV